MSPLKLAIDILNENFTGDRSREDVVKAYAQAEDSNFKKALEERVAELKEPLFSDEDIAAFKAESETPRSRKFSKNLFRQDEYFHWLCLNERAIVLLEQGKVLPPDVAAHVIAYLRGEINKPSHAKSSRDGEKLRIAFAVAFLCEECDLKATRNDEPSHSESACDYVAKAYSQINPKHPAGYETVKKAWFKHKHVATIFLVVRTSMGGLTDFVGKK